jgi:hypothetical protein
MINKNALKQLIVTAVIALLFTFNSGRAQTNNRVIYSYSYDEVIDMVVRAVSDTSIKIALCKNTGKYAFSSTENGVPLNLFPPSNLPRILDDLEITMA